MTGKYFEEKFENSVGKTVIGGPSFSLLFYNCKFFSQAAQCISRLKLQDHFKFEDVRCFKLIINYRPQQ